MIMSNTASVLPDNAPAIVRALRADFDGRMMELWREAVTHAPSAPTEGLERTVHVHFTHGPLYVTAVFNCMSEAFTQLIARDANEVTWERPSFTISLFL
jgi:hypothetical protein